LVSWLRHSHTYFPEVFALVDPYPVTNVSERNI